MKIIIDTNVFMSGIFWSGPPAKLLEAWENKKIELVLSTDILNEYIRVGNILSNKYKGVSINDMGAVPLLRQKLSDFIDFI